LTRERTFSTQKTHIARLGKFFPDSGTWKKQRMSNKTENFSDRQIVERLQQGHSELFSLLVDRYSQRAYQIAYGVLNNKQDAEEVAQDVFIRIYRNIDQFRGDAEFTTWLYRIAINLARNKYRWNKCRGMFKNVSMDIPSEGKDGSEYTRELPEERMQPDQEIQIDEFQQRVNQELQQLPNIYREALMLRNIDNLSYEEIAELLGCKLGTIKSRIARAREELRKRLSA